MRLIKAAVAWAVAGFCVVLLPRVLSAQAADTLLVTVELVQSGDRILVEAVAEDTVLRLPAEPVADLLGASFSTPWVSVGALSDQWPAVEFRWLPLELRVVVHDPQRVLPASRRAATRALARTRTAMPMRTVSGPWLALAVDDSLRALLDVGYFWRGRLSVTVRADDAGAAAWSASAVPFRRVFLSYSDGVDRPPSASARLSAGPLWVSAAWTPERPVDVAGLARVGDVSAFASRRQGVLLIQPGAQVSVVVARTWEDRRTAARVTWGPMPASPFSFPATTIR